jgi:iron complex outermembrane recepter protein
VEVLPRRAGREDWAGRAVVVVSLALLGSPLVGFAADEPPSAIEQIVVTGNASVVERLNGVGSGTEIESDTLRLVGQNHIYETMVRVPGVWVSKGSEEEHLTAIRSPVYTGTGACGEFLYLENAVPIRPAGFCNINNLFEVNSEQAERIEVLRGAGSALFGSNAMHGAINVVTPTAAEPGRIAYENGPDGFDSVRASASLTAADQLLRFDGLGVTTNGYRDDTGHDEQKVTLTQLGPVAGWDVHTTLEWTNLNQETGGFVIGYGAYKDNQLRFSNPNPESYRDAWSLRFVTEWQRALESGMQLDITPYFRRSQMQFLQHFLPGEPLEQNGQNSAGVQTSLSGAYGNLDWRTGADFEWATGNLYEFQQRPAVGSAFIVATRPVGAHYDYDVDSLMGALHYDLRYAISDDFALVQSTRLEYLGYDYTNHMLDGNTRDDGTPCPIAACLYTRPPDRDDSFTNVAVRLGAEWTIDPGFALYGLASNGFRPPQASELYRLQSGQRVADLKSEQVTSYEIGGRGRVEPFGTALDYSTAIYVERSTHVILRDASGFNVSNGKINGAGIEFDLTWTPIEGHQLSVIGAYSKFTYAFDGGATGGEIIKDGHDVDTAPHWLGSAHWRWEPTPRIVSEVEMVYQGEYNLDAASTAKYDGFTLWNWRGTWQVDPHWELFARVMNIGDIRYADRADIAFGSYRYFPGAPRQVFVGVEMSLGDWR